MVQVQFGLCCIDVEHPSEDLVDSWLCTCPKLRREVITVNTDIFSDQQYVTVEVDELR